MIAILMIGIGRRHRGLPVQVDCQVVNEVDRRTLPSRARRGGSSKRGTHRRAIIKRERFVPKKCRDDRMGSVKLTLSCGHVKTVWACKANQQTHCYCKECKKGKS